MVALNFDVNQPREIEISDTERLARQLERLRAGACEGTVSIPLATLDTIVAKLRSWPRKRTGKDWTPEIRFHALYGLYYGDTVDGLAREISETYGLSLSTVERRIAELKASDEFRELITTGRVAAGIAKKVCIMGGAKRFAPCRV